MKPLKVLARWHRLVNHAIPCLVSLVIGVSAIMLFDRRTPVDIILGPIVPPIVQPDETAALHFKQNKYRDYNGVIQRWIVDSRGIVFNLTNADAAPGVYGSRGETEVVREFPVPHGISAGPATFHSRADLWCNVLQQFWWPMTTEYEYPFMVKRDAQ